MNHRRNLESAMAEAERAYKTAMVDAENLLNNDCMATKKEANLAFESTVTQQNYYVKIALIEARHRRELEAARTEAYRVFGTARGEARQILVAVIAEANLARDTAMRNAETVHSNEHEAARTEAYRVFEVALLKRTAK